MGLVIAYFCAIALIAITSLQVTLAQVGSGILQLAGPYLGPDTLRYRNGWFFIDSEFLFPTKGSGIGSSDRSCSGGRRILYAGVVPFFQTLAGRDSQGTVAEDIGFRSCD